MNHLPPLPFIAALLLGASTLPAAAEMTEPVKPLALRGIMDKLGRDLQTVTAAISREDWGKVAALAPEIAEHAEPPLTEKLRILAWVGGDAGKFRGFDGQTHEAATAMGEAARKGDGQAVIAALARVQQGCLGCHQGFRQAFVQHFYPK